MAPATGHRSKRHNNQPAITSFFSADRAAYQSLGLVHDHSTPTPHPPLPHDVQSSLLNVGMRVRKSVPEGYKNKAVDDGFVLPPPQSWHTYSAPDAPARAELQPFCGLHKTGGFLSQPGGSGRAQYPVGAHDPLPSSTFSSQSAWGSQLSTVGENDPRPLLPSAFGSSNKRALEEEQDEELDDDALLDDLEGPVRERAFARPRGGKGRPRGSGGPGAPAGLALPDDGIDFGEADFLRPGEEMEL